MTIPSPIFELESIFNTKLIITDNIKLIKNDIDIKQLIKVEPIPDINPLTNIIAKSAHIMLICIIQQQKEKEESLDIWEHSPYRDIVKLQRNNVGNVGENLINNICRASNISIDSTSAKIRRIGGGFYDCIIMGIPIEIKTAHLGSSSPSFQHELGEIPWKGSKYMIFVDIAPNCIYITIFKNFDEETYKGKIKLTHFPTKTITWRKSKGAFKLDTSIKINEFNVSRNYAIKIIQTTCLESIAVFIKSMLI